MKQLYLLTREQLISLAMHVKSQDFPEIFDPFTDQQLRDLIVDFAVTHCIDTNEDIL